MLGNGLLRRAAQLGGCAAALIAARTAAASDLDPTTGLLVSTDPKAIMIGFESSASMATYGVALTKYTKAATGGASTLGFVDAGGTALTDAELTAHAAPIPAVEGSHALLLGSGPTDAATGVLVPFSKISPAIAANTQIQITVWVHTSGATPTLTVTYGTGTLPVAGTFTTVTAIRTGRETSDGWAELTTGPIDTAVWGVPIAQIGVGLGANDARKNPSAALVIDALEIAPVAGTPVAASACTIATEATACGADGECQFGHCVPGYASWGPTPSQDDRGDFVDRWIALAKNVQGARNATANAEAMVAARDALAAPTVGGRQFFAGMIGLVNGLRNHHTSFGSPANAGLLQPLAEGASSSTLGACLGFGELDLLEAPGATDKTLGFIVYKVAATSTIGATLSVGDAVTKIDGIDPLTWVRSVYLTYATGVPADPGADLAWSAASVGWMISHRASTLEITHCASATDCTGTNQTVTTIDVAGPAWKNVQGTGLIGDESDPNILDCVERFQNTITPATPPTGFTGDYVTSGTVHTDTLAFQFDGTDTDFAAWEGVVAPPFAATPAPTKILFDVRQGNGGYAEDSELIAEEIRPKTQSIGDVGFSVASWDGTSTVSGLLAVLASAPTSCEQVSSATESSAPCDLVLDDYFLGDYFTQASFEESEISPSTPVTAFTPGGVGARVAWLQAADVSANDYLAALIQGRENQRVFAPGPTSGAYGTISSTASLLLGWRGGSIQMTDSLWGADVAALSSTTFRSGVGVAPDEIVAQTMSDAINGVDTMITAAQAWLDTGVAASPVAAKRASSSPTMSKVGGPRR